MPTTRGNNRNQIHLFGKTVDDYIAENHFSRQVVKFIEDEAPMEKFHRRTAPGGKAQFDPCSLMSLFVHCFNKSIYTGRAMAEEARENLVAMFIMAGEFVSHDTISRFISTNSLAIVETHTWFTRRMIQEGRASTEKVQLDGTKYAASASLGNSVKYGEVDAAIQKSKDTVAELEGELATEFLEIRKLKEDSDEQLLMKEEITAKIKLIEKQVLREFNLEEGKRNLEQEARVKVAEAHLRAQQESVIGRHEEELQGLLYRGLVLKSGFESLEAEKQEKWKGISRQAARSYARKPFEGLCDAAAALSEDWDEFGARVKLELDAECGDQLSEKEIDRRAKKFLSSNKHLNTTDADSRMMLMGNTKSIDMAYNVQHAIDKDSMLPLAVLVTRDENDKQQLLPIIRQILSELGGIKQIDTDCGYHSGLPIDLLTLLGIDLYVPAGRQKDGTGKARKKKKKPMTRQATYMEDKLELPEYKERSEQRSRCEIPFGDYKRNDRFTRIEFRGLEKVEAVINMKVLSTGIQAYFKLLQLEAEEGEGDEETLEWTKKQQVNAEYQKSLRTLEELRAQRDPPQQVLQLE